MTDVFALNRRSFERKQSGLEARVVVGDANTRCTIEDISPGGAQIVAPLDLSLGRRLMLTIQPFGEFNAVVAWCRRGKLGIKFDEDPQVMAEVVMSIAMHG